MNDQNQDVSGNGNIQIREVTRSLVAIGVFDHACTVHIRVLPFLAYLRHHNNFHVYRQLSVPKQRSETSIITPLRGGPSSETLFIWESTPQC